jgi:hypothetical protein
VAGRRDVADGLELGVRVDRKARLDDVGVQFVEQRRYLALVLVRKRGSWRLLAVAERGVENPCLGNLAGTIQCALEELDPPGAPTNPPCGT